MRIAVRVVAIFILLALGTAAALYATGRTRDVLIWIARPHHGFDPSRLAPRPDYADPAAWAALPDRDDRADYVPSGPEFADGQGDAPVAAFFVHPTTYLHGEDWNDPMRPGTATAENTEWVLANQASVFNGCCDVYVPRYRQTSLLHLWADDETRREARELAYGDVEAAFDYFIEHLSRGRPFILASHSQGTRHARQLLARRISGTPLAERMVAAYLLGGGVLREELDALPDIDACRSSADLGCVVHWATYGEGGGPSRPFGPQHEDARGTTLCTNPLTWRVDGHRVGSRRNRGAVAPTGRFQIGFLGRDRASGIEFPPLPAPLPGHTGARCRDGRLYVERQEDEAFARYSLGDDLDYHGLDYALFYVDLRENAQKRSHLFLVRNACDRDRIRELVSQYFGAYNANDPPSALAFLEPQYRKSHGEVVERNIARLHQYKAHVRPRSGEDPLCTARDAATMLVDLDTDGGIRVVAMKFGLVDGRWWITSSEQRQGASGSEDRPRPARRGSRSPRRGGRPPA